MVFKIFYFRRLWSPRRKHRDGNRPQPPQSYAASLRGNHGGSFIAFFNPFNHSKVDQKLLFYNLGTWFQNVYGNNPMELVRMVKKVLSVEQMIIQNASQQPNGRL
jgi:hypothetical protein